MSRFPKPQSSILITADVINRYYRVRLSNIPSTVTKEQLMIWLKIPLQFSQRIKFSDEQSLNQFMVVYVNSQASEKLL